MSKTDGNGQGLDEFHALTENEELKKIITDLEGRLRRSQTKNADLINAIREGAQAAAVILGNPPAVRKPGADTRKKGHEIALVHASDWQVGMLTDSFNMEVAKKRIDQFGDKIVELTGIERADHPVEEAHVLLGGDLVEGVQIFKTQAFQIDATLFRQIMKAVEAGEQLLRKLLANFQTVEVWEEIGNHGRLGRKGDYPEEDSADKLTYQLIRDKLEKYEKDGRLVWHEMQSWYSIVEFNAYRALLVHGDEVKSFGGQTPAFGITRKVNAWAAGVIEDFTDCYMGHWHQPLVLPLANGKGRIFVNPSLESDNVYAQEFVASKGTPGQRLNFVDPRKGRVTTERIVWLD